MYFLIENGKILSFPKGRRGQAGEPGFPPIEIKNKIF
jgi:hypothetical protein